MTVATSHAVQRVVERCREAGVDPREVLTVAVSEARKCRRDESVAVRCAVLPEQVGEAWGERSNGNQVWAVVREGKVRTVMLRRQTQPATAQAMRVDRVVVAR